MSNCYSLYDLHYTVDKQKAQVETSTYAFLKLY
ncbi:hypothetical protein CGJ87_18040 [Vibrio parahaemolyticus]|nr:hypothetical protein [Vibrio parahaemolyticus]TOC27817.1 hypothetical protein CGJ87_18040 [Vibrio parahaemolyticus]TOD03567.1 hypothetical protein CGJ71_17665 [Vibrio parahaemolyticus]TOD09717.1 hypothetical protein CGJ70_19805 [Vibrio parahaemolyticus]TOD11250.1 hypothetical protein CGJ73_14520 [Vibrio parahaemolyticus]